MKHTLLSSYLRSCLCPVLWQLSIVVHLRKYLTGKCRCLSHRWPCFRSGYFSWSLGWLSLVSHALSQAVKPSAAVHRIKTSRRGCY